MIHLVIISPGFPLNENDSTCLPFLQIYLLELLKNKSIHLSVIAEQYPAAENYKWHGIDVITLHKKEPLLYYKLIRFIRLKKILKKLNRQEGIEAIHNFWLTESATVAGKFAFENKIRHLVTFSGQDALKTNKALSKLHLYRGGIFCGSLFQQEKVFENTGIRPEIIELGIEPIETHPTKKEIDLIWCGWISKLKNYEQFVEIVAAVHKIHPLKKVVICGGGNDLVILKEKVRSTNLQDLIEVRGETPRAEVLALMKKSKVLVHSSEYESFGLTLAEALACGCYVVSKPVGIAYKNPEIFSCTTTGEFVGRIIFCLKKDKEKKSVTDYPVSKMAEQYFKVYKN